MVVKGPYWGLVKGENWKNLCFLNWFLKMEYRLLRIRGTHSKIKKVPSQSYVRTQILVYSKKWVRFVYECVVD